MTLSRPDDVLSSVLRPDNVTFRGKRLAELSDQETREGLIQALIRVAELEGRPVDYNAFDHWLEKKREGGIG